MHSHRHPRTPTLPACLPAPPCLPCPAPPAVFAGIGFAWYHYVYLLPKVDYNRVHPYTSWIPITGDWLAGLAGRAGLLVPGWAGWRGVVMR